MQLVSRNQPTNHGVVNILWCRDQDWRLEKAIIFRSALCGRRIGWLEDIFEATDLLLSGSSTGRELTLPNANEERTQPSYAERPSIRSIVLRQLEEL